MKSMNIQRRTVPSWAAAVRAAASRGAMLLTAALMLAAGAAQAQRIDHAVALLDQNGVGHGVSLSSACTTAPEDTSASTSSSAKPHDASAARVSAPAARPGPRIPPGVREKRGAPKRH